MSSLAPPGKQGPIRGSAGAGEGGSVVPNPSSNPRPPRTPRVDTGEGMGKGRRPRRRVLRRGTPCIQGEDPGGWARDRTDHRSRQRVRNGPGTDEDGERGPTLREGGRTRWGPESGSIFLWTPRLPVHRTFWVSDVSPSSAPLSYSTSDPLTPRPRGPGSLCPVPLGVSGRRETESTGREKRGRLLEV